MRGFAGHRPSRNYGPRCSGRDLFLTLNGHYWPPGRVTLRNASDNDVQVHVTDYQNRYYGGGAMLRLYHFDLERNVIDAETLSPWALSLPRAHRRGPVLRADRFQ
jgi:hypothetical protein